MTDERVLKTVIEALTEVGPRLTRSRLEEFAGLEADRARLLAEFVYGSITWSTDLGQPDRQTLAAGFKITHQYCRQDVIPVPCGGWVIHEEWDDAGDVVSWDGNAADGKHHVGFLAPFILRMPPKPNLFSVDMVRMAWRDGGPFSGVRDLRPRSAYVAAPSRIAFLEFEVVQIPDLEIERAGVLTQ
jgi:hypothetical protein